MIKKSVLEAAHAAYPTVMQALETLEEIGFLEYLRENATVRGVDPDSPNFASECLIENGRSLGYREMFYDIMQLIEVVPVEKETKRIEPLFGAKKRLLEKGLIKENSNGRPKPNVSNGTTS